MMIAKVLQLLQPDEKRRGLKVIASVIISAVLDFVSVAMLLPLLYFLLDGVAQQQATLLFCVLAIMALLLKAIFSTFLTRFQQKFLLDVYKRMSFSLLERYYQNGLLFIKEKGVNKLSYEVNFVCYAFGQNTLLPFMNICGEGLLILLMMIAVFVYDWSIALILLLSFAPMLLIYVFGLRQKVREFGRLELEARRKQSRVVMETFAGYAELEVNDAFTAKSEDFCEGMNKIADSRMKMETLSKLPLLMSELSAVIGLGALAFYANGDVKAIVGIFAVAAFRMLPAFRSILSNWSHIQNSASGVQVIEEGLSELSDTMQAPESLCFKEEICLKNLFHQYDDNQKLISDFNETIRKGEYVGFCGFSGVGKSTLLNLLLGFIRPVSGEILIDNTPLSIDNRSSWLKMIGYVQQDVFLFNASLAENIALGYKNINQVKLADVLEKVCLSAWAAELPDGMDTVLGEFGARVSGGQRQRIGIARALYKEASVLLLDEATSALDDATEKEINIMIDRLRRSGEGLTILSVAHRASTLSYCDRIVKMH